MQKEIQTETISTFLFQKFFWGAPFSFLFGRLGVVAGPCGCCCVGGLPTHLG